MQAERLGHAAEKVAENILEDLFAGPLDRALADVNYQVDCADMELTRLGVKHLIVRLSAQGRWPGAAERWMTLWIRRPATPDGRRWAQSRSVRVSDQRVSTRV